MICYDHFINRTYSKSTLGLGLSALAKETVILESFWNACMRHNSLVEHQQQKRIGADLLGAHVSKQIALMWPERKNTRKMNQMLQARRSHLRALFKANLIKEKQGSRNLVSSESFLFFSWRERFKHHSCSPLGIEFDYKKNLDLVFPVLSMLHNWNKEQWRLIYLGSRFR